MDTVTIFVNGQNTFSIRLSELNNIDMAFIEKYKGEKGIRVRELFPKGTYAGIIRGSDIISEIHGLNGGDKVSILVQ